MLLSQFIPLSPSPTYTHSQGTPPWERLLIGCPLFSYLSRLQRPLALQDTLMHPEQLQDNHLCAVLSQYSGTCVSRAVHFLSQKVLFLG